MIEFAQDPTRYMEMHSEAFHAEFMSIFSTRYKEKKIDANRLYQEVISNPEHVHLNSTKWMTLTGYVKHLGQSGLAKVEETETGFDITYIDRSRETVEKQEQARKRALIERTEEERERKALMDQVQKATLKANAGNEEASSSTTSLPQELKPTELIRDSEKEPIKLQMKTLLPAKKELKITKLSALAKASGVSKKKNPLKG